MGVKKKVLFHEEYKLSLEKPLTGQEINDILKNIKMGTREWAAREINCIKGCKNYCLYCYAKGMAKHFNRCFEDTWKEMEVNWKAVNKGYRKSQKKVSQAHDIMFPTSHDIFLEEPYFSACITVLKKILNEGNTVLITLKPQLEVVKKLSTIFDNFKQKITFRFTIGSINSEVLKLFELNAPSFEERLESLKYATHHGFHTTVSIEPLLDFTPNELIKKISPHLSPLNYEKDHGTIWIGLLKKQYIPKSLRIRKLKEYLEKITPKLKFEHVYQYYKEFYNNPTIKWKESILKMMIKNNIKVKGMLY